MPVRPSNQGEVIDSHFRHPRRAGEAHLDRCSATYRPNPVAGSTDELMHEIAAAAGDPDLFAKLRGRLLSTLRTATYDPTVHGHYGLRLSAYAHVTSPLRRVADLINQRIIHRVTIALATEALNR